MTEFESFWRAHYGDCPPLGHRLREAFPDRWVRFHSLPGSKRYAENEAEMAEVLSRAQTIAALVLGEDAPCWIVTARYEAAPSAFVSLELDGGSLELPYTCQYVDRDPAVEDPALMAFYATTTTWRSEAFEPLLKAIADWVGNALWVNSRTAAVFAPYDGGLDVILPTQAESLALRDRFPAWRSAHPSGL